MKDRKRYETEMKKLPKIAAKIAYGIWPSVNPITYAIGPNADPNKIEEIVINEILRKMRPVLDGLDRYMKTTEIEKIAQAMEFEVDGKSFVDYLWAWEYGKTSQDAIAVEIADMIEKTCGMVNIQGTPYHYDLLNKTREEFFWFAFYVYKYVVNMPTKLTRGTDRKCSEKSKPERVQWQFDCLRKELALAIEELEVRLKSVS